MCKKSILCDNDDCEVCSKRNLKNLNPWLFEKLMYQFDKKKNIGINLEKLPFASTQKIWWDINGDSIYCSLVTRTYGYKTNFKCNIKQIQLCHHDDCSVCSQRNIKNLDPKLYQQLIKEFDKVKNKYKNGNVINLLKLSYGCNINLWWNCDNGHSYEAPLYRRTANSSGCLECYHDSKRKYPKETIEKLLLRDDSKITSTCIVTGEINEQYVYDLLKKHPKVDDIQLIGYFGGFGDIRIKLKGYNNYKLLQVKTLVKKLVEPQVAFYISNKQYYPDELLIAMINNDHDHFAIEFAGNFKEQNPCFTFNCTDSKYKDIMFTDKNIFIKTIIANINDSVTNLKIEDQLTECQKKEYFMRQRLKLFCENHDMSYRDNITNSNTIDCYINDIPIQLKYTGSKPKNTKVYLIRCHKTAGIIDKKCIPKPYHINDGFEYIIVELYTYHNQFCILPKKELHKLGTIADNNGQKGHKSTTISPPDYERKHWTLPFWNNWNGIIN